MKVRIEFTLSMPSCGSWNGKWSGADKRYAIVRSFSAEKAKELLSAGSWSHRWEDGWCAGISAREVVKGERMRKSDGFCGYNWMVANIVDHGTPYTARTVTP
jgi:hypothetical protein